MHQILAILPIGCTSSLSQMFIVLLPAGYRCIQLAFDFFFKMGHSRPLFLYFRLFYKPLTGNIGSIKVANDWI